MEITSISYPDKEWKYIFLMDKKMCQEHRQKKIDPVPAKNEITLNSYRAGEDLIL